MTASTERSDSPCCRDVLATAPYLKILAVSDAAGLCLQLASLFCPRARKDQTLHAAGSFSQLCASRLRTPLVMPFGGTTDHPLGPVCSSASSQQSGLQYVAATLCKAARRLERWCSALGHWHWWGTSARLWASRWRLLHVREVDDCEVNYTPRAPCGQGHGGPNKTASNLNAVRSPCDQGNAAPLETK